MITTDAKIARYYQSVTPELRQKLIDFRQRYPYQQVEIGRHTWRFIDTGVPDENGKLPLVLLAGATTVAEMAFLSIEHFARNHRLIAPDYPPISTLKDFFAGLMALLDKLGVDHFNLMGGSYGGWLAQSLVRAEAPRIHKLVLAAICAPDPHNSRSLAKIIPLLRLLPMGVFRAMLNRSFSRLDVSKEYPEMALAGALVKEIMETRLKRADLRALMERLVDQTAHYTFTASDLKDWHGQILMIFGSQDPTSPLEKRQEMQALYPQAQMVVFEGGQHGIALTHQQAYFAAIDEFLNAS